MTYPLMVWTDEALMRLLDAVDNLEISGPSSSAVDLESTAGVNGAPSVYPASPDRLFGVVR